MPVISCLVIADKYREMLLTGGNGVGIMLRVERVVRLSLPSVGKGYKGLKECFAASLKTEEAEWDQEGLYYDGC